MASVSGVLQDNDGNDLYPYTFDQEVLDANNVPISQRLGSASEASAVSGSSAFAKINTLSSELTDWTDITNSCSWAVAAAFDSNYPKCVKVKPKAGLMYIKFVLAAGIANGTTILTLPSGYSLDKQVFLRMKEDGYVKQIDVDTSDTRIIKLIRDANVATTDNTPITVTVPYYVS